MSRALNVHFILFTASGLLATAACSGSSDSSQSDAGFSSVGGGTAGSGGTTLLGGFSGIGGTHTTGGLSNAGGTISTGGTRSPSSTLATGGATQAAQCPSAPPAQSAPCGSSSLNCFYDQCPNTGRTQATCDSSGHWNVQTASCGTVSCTGYVTTYTCSSGWYCRISAGGAIMATCTTSSCGEGPITAQCLSAYGCTIYTSLTAGVTVMCNSCPAGSGGCA